MSLFRSVSKYTPLVFKRSFRAVVKKIPKRYELPFQYFNYRLRGALEDEMRLLKGLVGRGEIAVDVGANIGFYSYALSKLCARVEAFEPNPACIAVLEAYGARNIRTHNVGLSSHSGMLDLHTPVVDGKELAPFATVNVPATNYVSRTVAVRRLDDYGFTPVSFIKIDVEGHELEVIRGATQTLSREKPNLLIEVEQRHLFFPMQVVFDELLKLGYQGYFLYGGALRPLAEFSYEHHQRPFLDGDSGQKYVNNFIFKF